MSTISVNTCRCLLLCHMCPDVPILYHPLREWSPRWIIFAGPEAKAFEDLGYICRQRPVVADVYGAVSQAFPALMKLTRREDVSAPLERKAVILNMVSGISRAANATPGQRRRSRALEKVVTFLRGHYTEDLSVPGIATRFSLSATHFRTLFKEHTGSCPTEFITSLRIARAKELLSRGKTIKAIAYELGYRDVFYFMRVFKRVVGVPPGKYAAMNG